MKDVSLMTTQEARELIESLQESERAAIIIIKALQKQNDEARARIQALEKELEKCEEDKLNM